MKKSGFLERHEIETERIAQAVRQIYQQFMIDTLQIAINQSEGWGYDRIMRLTSAWEDVRRQYKDAVQPNHMEADVAQEHMDRVLLQIISGRQALIPFHERYPGLKTIKYGKGKRFRC